MKPKEEALTVERLRELLDYSPETGEFRWRVSPSNSVSSGSVAGAPDRKGYWYIQIAGARYLAHRLVWLYVNAVWPKEQIDHVNCTRADNRITNLREATPTENGENIRHAKTNSSTGLLGVSWYKRTGKFTAKIKVNGKQLHLGYFYSAEDAYAAYLVAKRKYHSHCTL